MKKNISKKNEKSRKRKRTEEKSQEKQELRAQLEEQKNIVSQQHQVIWSLRDSVAFLTSSQLILLGVLKERQNVIQALTSNNHFNNQNVESNIINFPQEFFIQLNKTTPSVSDSEELKSQTKSPGESSDDILKFFN